jgi:hypothetical protein
MVTRTFQPHRSFFKNNKKNKNKGTESLEFTVAEITK